MRPRWLILLTALMAVVIGSGLAWLVFRPQPATGPGGPFALVDVNGRPFTDQNLRGKPSVIYFGFTYCPEACPTTLMAETRWLRQLGPDADRLNVVFISIDPERDTPAVMKAYLKSFDPRIIGLTGSTQAVAKAAKAWSVYYQKVPTNGGDYTMDHSTALYLMDANGHFVRPLTYGVDEAQALAALRALLKS
jgi:protein SCO1